MKTIKDIRFNNARLLAKQVGSQKDIVAITGRHQSQISQIMGKKPSKPIGNAVARALEKAFKKPVGWLDQLHYDNDVDYVDNTANQVQDATVDSLRCAKQNVQWVSCISWNTAISWCNKDNSNDLESCDWLPTHQKIGPRSFVLRMHSDEATNYSGDKSYPINSLLFVDPDSDVAEGNYVIAKVHHLYTPICRKLVANDGEQKLVPINYNQEDTTQYAENEFDILGVIKFGIT